MIKKLRRKIIFFPIILGALLFAGIGCKGLSVEQQEAIKPITLNYWTIYNDVEQLRAFAAEYKLLRSYVTVNIRQVRYEEFDSLFANALADDVAPDIVSMSPRWLSKYQTRLDPMPASVTVANVRVEGQLQPKTIVTPETNGLPTKNYLERAYVGTVAADIIREDKVYGLPLALDTLAMYYNVDLLDKAGVAVPPKTWEEFSAAVKKTTLYDRSGVIIQSGAALGAGENIDNAYDIISLLMLQNGVEMARGSRVSFADALDDRTPNHPALQAMQFYTDFARPTKDVYSWNESMCKALDEFARGKSVFYFGFAFDAPRLRARGPQIKYAIEPVPQLNSAAPVNAANYWFESVVGKSAHKEEAWDFIRFITLPENVKKYVAKTGQPSPLRDQLVEQENDTKVSAFALQALTAKNWYQGKDIDATVAAFNNLFRNYLQPLGERENELRRNVSLIQTAARVIQQTF